MARGPMTWEIANCLSLCGGGPNLVIYPDEEWHHQLDADTLERVIAALRSPDARDP
jgi:(2Fe-2S) ferredoxin